jgi:glyoxylase-like metal-dependent hydrolase (beta-lactamase superfamily II)
MDRVTETENVHIDQLDVGGRMWANCYLVTSVQTGESALIDAPGKADLILEQLQGKNLKCVLMTHNHSDHIGSLAKLKSTLRIPVYGHADDALGYPVSLAKELTDGEDVAVGNLELHVFHTPGHTPGSLCFLADQFLFSGDTLFPGGPGYTDSPGNFQSIIRSITGKILSLPNDTIVYPGHGAPTLLGKEKDELRIFLLKQHPSNLCGDVLWLGN